MLIIYIKRKSSAHWKKEKKADIVVFDGNLFETAIEEIRSRKVEVTFLNGRIVYSHE